MQTLRNSRAFTIVELLVVVVVIAILASIVIVSYNGVQKNAINASVQSDLRSAATAIAVEVNHNNLSSVTSFPSTVKTSPKVGLSLATPASGSTYCINGSYAGSSTVRYYFDSVVGIKQGACPGAHIAGTVIGDGAADPSGTGEQPGAPSGPQTPQPVVLISDNFDRANSTTALGTAQTGQTWPPINALGADLPKGQWGISSNRAYSVTNGDGDFTVFDSTATNTEVSVRIYGLATKFWPGLIARGVDKNVHYIVEITGQNGEMILGGATQLDSAPPGTYHNGDLLTFRTEIVSGGTKTTVLVNGNVVMEGTDDDTNRPTGTFYGIRHGVEGTPTNTIRFDDFTLKSI